MCRGPRNGKGFAIGGKTYLNIFIELLNSPKHLLELWVFHIFLQILEISYSSNSNYVSYIKHSWCIHQKIKTFLMPNMFILWISFPIICGCLEHGLNTITHHATLVFSGNFWLWWLGEDSLLQDWNRKAHKRGYHVEVSQFVFTLLLIHIKLRVIIYKAILFFSTFYTCHLYTWIVIYPWHTVKSRTDATGEVTNQQVHMPGILPKIPGRFYFYFGKPIETEGMPNAYFTTLECPWNLVVKIILPT